MIVARGTSATFSANFRTNLGLVDPVSPRVEVRDPVGSLILTATPVRDSLGTFHYVYSEALDAALGTASIHWFGTINGVEEEATEYFDVVVAGFIGAPTDLLASLADVHRMLGDSAAPDTSHDADYAVYLQTASEWLRRHTGREWSSATGPFTETFDNVRADDFIDLAAEGATVSAVVAYPVISGLGIPLAPPAGYTLSPGVSYQMAGDRVQLLWNAIGTPFEGASDYISPMHYQRVVVTYTTPGIVPAPIRDGCAYLAVALKTAGPRIAAGLLSEQNEDYRYQLATEVAMGDPLIRGLIRDYRKRRVLVV